MIKHHLIYRKIKKYDTIVLARHIGPDPDALGSTLGLKECILNTFPDKKVYVVGTPSSRHKYMGSMDNFQDDFYKKSLLIVLDTPNMARVDGVDPNKFEYKIKIDHHPFVEKFCDIEIIDESASSASQMVIELIYKTPLKMCKSAAEKLYVGVVADTNRFLYYYTTPKTFDLVSKMIKDTKLDFTSLYENMYLRPYKEVKFQSYILMNMDITDNGLATIKLPVETLEEFNIDAATACNVVNNLTYIGGIYTWAIFAYDKPNEIIRGSLRSRGAVINDVAANHNGGGHIYAAGVKVKTFEEVDQIIEELDEVCQEYKKGMEQEEE